MLKIYLDEKHRLYHTKYCPNKPIKAEVINLTKSYYIAGGPSKAKQKGSCLWLAA